MPKFQNRRHPGIVSVLIVAMQMQKKVIAGNTEDPKERGLPLYKKSEPQAFKRLREKRERRRRNPLTNSELSGSLQEGEDEEAAVERVTNRNLKTIAVAQPWMGRNGPYTPWYDEKPNDLSAGLGLRRYPTINPKFIVNMSNEAGSCTSFHGAGGAAMSSVAAPNKFCKVLICAPSNMAIDEVLRKIIKDGLISADGEKYEPKVVLVFCKAVNCRGESFPRSAFLRWPQRADSASVARRTNLLLHTHRCD